MSVTVRHLNADSSFLLSFSPDPNTCNSHEPQPLSTYTVLIDPWLEGPSVVTHPKFAITVHTVAPCINHLSEIDEPDLVIISQNKPDHCHAKTLRQLRPEGKTLFAAEPGAAKGIKSWNHFDPARVFALPKYDPKRRFSLLRFHIPPLALGGEAGEVTVAFMPAKNYITGLHNGIGITYQAPTATKTLAHVCTIDLPRHPQYENPFSPATVPPSSPLMPFSPVEAQARPSTADGSYPHPIPVVTDYSYDPRKGDSEETESATDTRVLSPSLSSPPSQMTLKPNATLPVTHHPPTPPESPLTSSTLTPSIFATSIRTYTHTPSSSFSSTSLRPRPLDLTGLTRHPARPRPLSILYTPHGIPLPDLQPYILHHLLPLSALPLTLLLHSFSRADNPWFLGGNILAGTSNGIEIARALMARIWLSAHDEAKHDRGMSVKTLRSRKYSVEEVRKLYADDDDDNDKEEREKPVKRKSRSWTCDIRDLDVGESLWIGSEA